MVKPAWPNPPCFLGTPVDLVDRPLVPTDSYVATVSVCSSQENVRPFSFSASRDVLSVLCVKDGFDILRNSGILIKNQKACKLNAEQVKTNGKGSGTLIESVLAARYIARRCKFSDKGCAHHSIKEAVGVGGGPRET